LTTRARHTDFVMRLLRILGELVPGVGDAVAALLSLYIVL
jgi:hypothetical protein